MKKDIFTMEGKTVIVTGGCGYLGKAIVKILLEYGANVVIPTRTDKLDESFDEYKKAGRVIVVPTDLKSTQATKDAFRKTEELFGKIDVLVNCAYYNSGTSGGSKEFRMEKMDDDTWNQGVDGSLGIVFRCTRDIIPYFEKNNGGNIINVGSMYGKISPDFAIYGDNIPWNPPYYGAGKAGVRQFTRYCAAVLADKNIRVNCLIPGPFPNISPDTDKAFIERLSAKTMMKRTGKAEELQGALMLLASDASSFMTGTEIVVDGGMTEW